MKPITGGVRLRRDSLRSYGGTNCDVQLSLPGLPENNQQRVHFLFFTFRRTGSRLPRARRDISEQPAK